jgi:hypothetical protein
VTNRYPIIGPELVLSTTGDAKNHGGTAASPLSPASPLKMKGLLKRYTRSNPSTSNTSDTGDVVRKIIGLGVGEAANFRGSTP